MFEDSDLLQQDVLVLRATAPPDDQFTVLDEKGREIGRVIAEEGLGGGKQSAWLVLYDRQHTPLLIVEHPQRHDETRASYLDGHGQPIDSRLVRLKLPGVFGKRPHEYTFRDARKREVGSYAFALPPEGDHRLGVTLLFTMTEAVSRELRLATLGFAIDMADGMSRKAAWMLKGTPGIGQAWPGSANGHLQTGR
jgi:hypothetical protein